MIINNEFRQWLCSNHLLSLTWEKMLWHLILVSHCTVVLMIFLLIFVIELISRWTCWSVIRTFSLWRPQSHHIYDLYESCGGRGSYSFSASWSVGSASGRKSSLLVQCGVTRNLWFKVSLITVFPHIVSSLEYLPPLNNFRSKNLRIPYFLI